MSDEPGHGSTTAAMSSSATSSSVASSTTAPAVPSTNDSNPLIAHLLGMGFTDAAAAAALTATGGESVDAALTYLVSEGDDLDHKLVLVVDSSLHMRTGKIAAQCAHAALGSYMSLMDKSANNTAPSISLQSLHKWLDGGQMKVVVSVPSADALAEVRRSAKRFGLHSYTVHDAGRTQVAAGSATVVAVGPGPAHLINQVTGQLKLL